MGLPVTVPTATVRRAESLFPTGKPRHHLFQPAATLGLPWRRGIFNTLQKYRNPPLLLPQTHSPEDDKRLRSGTTEHWKKSYVKCLCYWWFNEGGPHLLSSEVWICCLLGRYRHRHLMHPVRHTLHGTLKQNDTNHDRTTKLYLMDGAGSGKHSQ